MSFGVTLPRNLAICGFSLKINHKFTYALLADLFVAGALIWIRCCLSTDANCWFKRWTNR